MMHLELNKHQIELLHHALVDAISFRRSQQEEADCQHLINAGYWRDRVAEATGLFDMVLDVEKQQNHHTTKVAPAREAAIDSANELHKKILQLIVTTTREI